jgi:hypothetical protein
MRSDFLVHWTGKDIGTDPQDTAKRAAYLDRLVSILTDGFWMTVPTERMEGFGPSFIEYHAHMTCFTEIRLSQASTHSKRYGRLGIGVDRRFVLDRFGGPVHYVRNHPTECVIGNAQDLNIAITASGDARLKAVFAIKCAFLKAMSNVNADDFEYLEENEWRIVETDTQVQQGRIVLTGLARPQFRVPIAPNDLRLIVFPDDATRTSALSDPRITSLLGRTAHRPILLTTDECRHF